MKEKCLVIGEGKDLATQIGHVRGGTPKKEHHNKPSLGGSLISGKEEGKFYL